MGKAKKGRKSVKDEDLDSDAEVEMTPTEAAPKPTKPKGKSKLKTDDSQKNPSDEDDNASDIKAAKKKKNIDDKKVTEVSKDVKKMNIGSKKTSKKKMASSDDDSNSESEAESVDIKPTKSKAKPEPKRGFALLQMDDSDDSPQSSESDEDSESEEEKPKIVPQKKQPQKDLTKEQTTKKGKKGKKKKDDSDDDIDKVLAELEQEYSGKQASSSKKEKTQTEKSLNDETKEDVKSDITTQEPANNEKENVEDTATAKSAAQKKKEKKLKQQAAKKLEILNKESTPDPDPETVTVQSSTTVPNDVPIAKEVETSKAEDQTEDSVESDKKKKKKKQEKPVEEKSKKGPAKKAIAAMQDALKKIKEEEERLQKEEEERIKLEEERENQRLELLRLEKEKKDRKKKKEKERKERLKAEGKFMTPKQKADKARALAMIESLKEQGAEISAEDQPRKPRLGTRIRPNKLKKQSSDEQQSSNKEESNKVDVEIVDSKTDGKEVIESKIPDIKDSWDAESASSDNDQDEDEEEKPVASETGKEASDSSDGNDSESEGESESSDEDPEDTSSDTIAARQKTIIRMKKREEENEANKSAAVMRAAVVCVLGHVDTGKTKILDKLRRTNVQDGEAGGITQQIGATNVPIENIKEQTRHVKGVNQVEFKIPGLLIIDTPGHESFSNLRSRGSSLCDIAILVVDIMHGLEPQTIESINLLKARKTPFIVALNKIDRLYDWQSAQRKDVRDIIKSQHVNTQNEFETRTKETILQFAEQGLNAALYYENPDVRTYVSLVPTSAVTGEGMGNLLAIIIQACEGLLHKRLLFSQTLQATVLEVKAISGLGMTIDTILINGTLKEGDTIVLAGTDGPIVTQIRSLLMPQPMKELRVKNAYIEYKEVVAAQGVKITGKDLEKAVAGLNLQVAHRLDEIDILKEEAARELKKALSGIKLSERGVYVQASTLGSLEALLQFLKSSKIPYSAIRIGPVVKRDVMKASAMLEHEPQYACILAFDVKIERDAQEMADSLGVTIFQADIIYHLFDKFMAHREQLKARKREEFKHIAVFPCKLKILPQFVFNSRDPIVIGVIVEAGIVKQGTPICVPSKEFVEIGIVTSIEMSHKQVETARKGMEVCIKIDPIPGESPKMFGRHFEETDFLVSKISRQSIDACKDYFRDDLIKADWQLMVELKNLFQIL